MSYYDTFEQYLEATEVKTCTCVECDGKKQFHYTPCCGIKVDQTVKICPDCNERTEPQPEDCDVCHGEGEYEVGA